MDTNVKNTNNTNNINNTNNTNNIKNTNTFDKALNRAIGGGLSGSAAMVMQVSSLMWLRTTMNYQYRYGTPIKLTIQTLYNEGGIKRFYRGYFAALSLGPLARFGDVAANVSVINYFNDNPHLKNQIPTPIQTAFGSSLAASWRVFLMPIDTLKTTYQVEGPKAIELLKNKIRRNNIGILYNGSTAALSATFVGHYPWFLTYNLLNTKIPKYEENYKNFIRNGIIGFSSSLVSDTCSNSLRVIKTTKQTYKENESYINITKEILKKDGYQGLLTRGLSARILTNGIQGCMFTIIYRYLEDKYIK